MNGALVAALVAPCILGCRDRNAPTTVTAPVPASAPPARAPEHPAPAPGPSGVVLDDTARAAMLTLVDRVIGAHAASARRVGSLVAGQLREGESMEATLPVSPGCHAVLGHALPPLEGVRVDVIENGAVVVSRESAADAGHDAELVVGIETCAQLVGPRATVRLTATKGVGVVGAQLVAR